VSRHRRQLWFGGRESHGGQKKNCNGGKDKRMSSSYRNPQGGVFHTNRHLYLATTERYGLLDAIIILGHLEDGVPDLERPFSSTRHLEKENGPVVPVWGHWLGGYTGGWACIAKGSVKDIFGLLVPQRFRFPFFFLFFRPYASFCSSFPPKNHSVVFSISLSLSLSLSYLFFATFFFHIQDRRVLETHKSVCSIIRIAQSAWLGKGGEGRLE